MIIAYVDGGYTTKTGAYGSFAVYTVQDSSLPVGSLCSVYGVFAEVHTLCQSLKPDCVQRFSVCHPLGEQPDNNIAEAVALHTAVSWILNNGYVNTPTRVHFLMDSDQVIKQMLGKFAVKNFVLQDIYRSIYKSIELYQGWWKLKHNILKYIKYHWIPNQIMKSSVIGH